MAIRVLIERRIVPENQPLLSSLLMRLRSKAMQARGYISGETLRSLQDPNEYLVISTWNSLDDWKNAMIEKGVNRIGPGLDQSRSKIERFNRQFYAHLSEVEDEIRQMPDTTLEDNIARMVHNVRRNAGFKYE